MVHRRCRGCDVCVVVIVDMGDVAQRFLVDDVGDVAVVVDNYVAVVVVLVIDGVVWWRAGGRRCRHRCGVTCARCPLRRCGHRCGIMWRSSSMWYDMAVVVVVNVV